MYFLCLRVSDWGCIQIPENAYCFLGLIMVGMVIHPQPSIYGGSILGLPRISLGGLSSSVDGIIYLGSTVFWFSFVFMLTFRPMALKIAKGSYLGLPRKSKESKHLCVPIKGPLVMILTYLVGLCWIFLISVGLCL